MHREELNKLGIYITPKNKNIGIYPLEDSNRIILCTARFNPEVGKWVKITFFSRDFQGKYFHDWYDTLRFADEECYRLKKQIEALKLLQSDNPEFLAIGKEMIETYPTRYRLLDAQDCYEGWDAYRKKTIKLLLKGEL